MNANENKTMTPKVKFRIRFTSGCYSLECCCRRYYEVILNDRELDDADFIEGCHSKPSGEVCVRLFGPQENNAYNADLFYKIALCLIEASNPDLVSAKDYPDEPSFQLSFDHVDIYFKLVHPDLVQISIPMGNQNPPLLTEETLLNTVHELLNAFSQVSKDDYGYVCSTEKRIMQHALEGLGCNPSTVEEWLNW
jgi:hypothetical protein